MVYYLLLKRGLIKAWAEYPNLALDTTEYARLLVPENGIAIRSKLPTNSQSAYSVYPSAAYQSNIIASYRSLVVFFEAWMADQLGAHALLAVGASNADSARRINFSTARPVCRATYTHPILSDWMCV